jgi:hypothetical protein
VTSANRGPRSTQLRKQKGNLMNEFPSTTGPSGSAARDPRAGTGPWPCLPRCDNSDHRDGWTADELFGECSAYTELDTNTEFPFSGIERWHVGAHESTEYGMRTVGEVSLYLELDEEATANGFGITPDEARRWARALLRAADRAEGRPQLPPLVLAEDECARLFAAIEDTPGATCSPRVKAGLALLTGGRGCGR